MPQPAHISRSRSHGHSRAAKSRKVRPASYARELGIDLASKRERELFKWFLACLLFGKPIQREVAEMAYRRLVAAGLTSPEAILHAGWDRLVRLLDQAHYVRFDFSTASKLLDVSKELERGPGKLTELVRHAQNLTALSKRLQEIKHVGPVTARLFLREIRPVWFPRKPARA